MLIAVTGTGGTGATTVAASLAAHLARRSPTSLVDLTRHGDLRHRYGVARSAPGISEVQAGWPVEACTVQVLPRLALVPGLRDPTDWTMASDARTLAHALRELRLGGASVICDIGADLEGAERTGSPDVADRHLLARTAAALADVVLVVTAPRPEGAARCTTLLRDLDALGVGLERIGTVVVAGGRRWSQLATLRRSIDVQTTARNRPPTPPLVLPAHRRVARPGAAVPVDLPRRHQRRLGTYAARLGARSAAERRAPIPAGELVAPSSLGISRWRAG